MLRFSFAALMLCAVALFELTAANAGAATGAINPVCRMQVAADSAVATIAHGSTLYRFCSQACARVFAAAPERFTS